MPVSLLVGDAETLYFELNNIWGYMEKQEIIDELSKETVEIDLTPNNEVDLNLIDKTRLCSLVKAVDTLFAQQKYGKKNIGLRLSNELVPSLPDSFADNYIGGNVPLNNGKLLRLDTLEVLESNPTTMWPTDISPYETENINSYLTKHKPSSKPTNTWSLELCDICSPYTVVRRNDSGELHALGLHKYFEKEVEDLATCLVSFSGRTKDSGFIDFCNVASSLLIQGKCSELEDLWLNYCGENFEIICWPTDSYSDSQFGIKRHFRLLFGVKSKNDVLEDIFNRLTEISDFGCLPVKPMSKVKHFFKSVSSYWNIAVGGEAKLKPISASILPNNKNTKKVLVFRNTARDWLYEKASEGFKIFDRSEQNLLINGEANIDSLFVRIIAHEYAHGIAPDTVVSNGKYKNSVEELKAEIGGIFSLCNLYNNNAITFQQFKAYVLIWISAWLVPKKPNFETDWYESAGFVLLIEMLNNGLLTENKGILINWEIFPKAFPIVACEMYRAIQNESTQTSYLKAISSTFERQAEMVDSIIKEVGISFRKISWGVHNQEWLNENV